MIPLTGETEWFSEEKHRKQNGDFRAASADDAPPEPVGVISWDKGGAGLLMQP